MLLFVVRPVVLDVRPGSAGRVPFRPVCPSTLDASDPAWRHVAAPAARSRPRARTTATGGSADAQTAGSRIVVSTSTTCGTRGIDAKPNATGGSSGASVPSGSPAQVPDTAVTSWAPVTP